MLLSLNFTLGNATDLSSTPMDDEETFRHLSIPGQVLITCSYIFGIIVNVFSLVLLIRHDVTQNKKHTLMLTCLVCNDLIALIGSLFLMYMTLYTNKSLVSASWFCILRVLLRTFGLSSGCVALVMAIERCLALTGPFVYQKHVTYKLIKRAIFGLWLFVLVLVCLPFAGFGLYYDSEVRNKTQMCVRYRFAKTAKDIAYAYLVFSFGVILCVVIVCCNLAVVIVLCRIGNKKRVSRLGRTTIHRKNNELSFNHPTAEEVSFAKLMVVLCVFFVICWVPQLATIVVAQTYPDSGYDLFYRMADVCIAMNFALDPVVYVLSRRPHRKDLRKFLKPICQICSSKPDRIPSVRTTSQELTRTSGETVINGSRKVRLTPYQEAEPVTYEDVPLTVIDVRSGTERPSEEFEDEDDITLRHNVTNEETMLFSDVTMN